MSQTFTLPDLSAKQIKILRLALERLKLPMAELEQDTDLVETWYATVALLAQSKAPL